jgi:hypothetical protein
VAMHADVDQVCTMPAGTYRRATLQCADSAGWLLVQITMPYGGIPVKDTGCANVLVTGGLAAV